MEILKGRRQPPEVRVAVALGGGGVPVAKEALDRDDVLAVLHQQGGKGVPKEVRGDPAAEAGLPLHPLNGPAPLPGDEDGRVFKR